MAVQLLLEAAHRPRRHWTFDCCCRRDLCIGRGSGRGSVHGARVGRTRICGRAATCLRDGERCGIARAGGVAYPAVRALQCTGVGAGRYWSSVGGTGLRLRCEPGTQRDQEEVVHRHLSTAISDVTLAEDVLAGVIAAVVRKEPEPGLVARDADRKSVV